MKKSIKMWAVIVAVILSVCMVLSGCSEKPDTKGSANSGESAEVSGNLVAWIYSDTTCYDVAVAALDDFHEQFPEVSTDFISVSGNEMHTKLMTAMTANAGMPDLCQLGVWDVMNFVSNNSLVDLTEKLTPYIDDLLSYQLAEYTQEQKIYGVPWGGTAATVYYRTDIYEKAGISASEINTWDDFIQAGKQLVDNTDSYMLNLAVGASSDKAGLQELQQLLAQQLGTSIYNTDGEIVINDDGNVRALQLICDMIDAEISSNIEPWSANEFAAWQDGTIASVVNAAWMKGSIEGQAGNDGNWGMYPLPAFEEGGTRVSSAGGSGFVIPQAAKNVDAAWAFTEFFLLNDDQQIAAYESGSPVPSLMTTYSASVFQEKESFWGDQEVGKYFTEIEPEVLDVNYGKDFREIITSLLSVGVWNATTGEQTPEEALNDVRDKIQDKFGY